VNCPEEFSVSPKAVVEWRTAQLQSASKITRPAELAFHRRWLAAELADIGWQPVVQGNEHLTRDDYLLRLFALAAHDRQAEATASAYALSARWPEDGDTLYDCACVHALAASAVKGDAVLADRYAARAVALLPQAADAGYKDAKTLRKNPDLNALQGRDDFKKLLKEHFQSQG